jgi:Hypothetical glycosyl hydrolase family 15
MPASATAGINLGLAFDYATHDWIGVSKDVDYIFGGYLLSWNFGFYPRVSAVDGYIPFDREPLPQSVPGHSLAYWKARHPDWIVYRCDRRTPAYYGNGNTSVPLDFSNPAVRAWQVDQAAKLFGAGATGVAFDNFTFANFDGRCGVYRNGVWSRLGYPGWWRNNRKQTADMIVWLRSIRRRLLREFPTKTLTVNFTTELSGLRNLKAIVPYIDMDFDEAGFSDYGRRRISGLAWQHEVDGLEYLNSRGKAFFVNGVVGAANDQSVTHDDLNWALANYLLVKGAQSYTYVYAGDEVGGSPSGYGTFYDRPEYHVQVGFPVSSRYESQGVQMRRYSHGLAIVNPSGSRAYTVRLSRTYRDMYGAAHSFVRLAPTTGIVLLG